MYYDEKFGRLLAVAAICMSCSCSSTARRIARPTTTVVVLEAGAEPRQRLQYDPPPGVVEEIETTTKVRVARAFTNTRMNTGYSIAALPTMIIRGRLHVTGRSANGHALVSFAVDDVRTLDDIVDPAPRQIVDGRTHGLKNARVRWRLLPTGEVADITVDLPNTPNATRDRVLALAGLFEEMFVRFPEVDLGVGAIWRVESNVTTLGVTWTRRASYTLRALTDGQAVVDVSVTMAASSQDLRVEPNATTTFTSGTGTIHGQAFVPRSGLIISGSSQATIESNFSTVRRRARIKSTVRTENISSTKRIDSNVRSAPDISAPKKKEQGTTVP